MVNTRFGVINLKLSNYKKFITVDERLKVPVALQISESLTRMIYNRQIFLDEELPHPELLADSLGVKPLSIERAYQTLIDENLARFDEKYYVAHHDFVYDYYGQRLPIEEALRKHGYEPRIKYHPSVIKTEGDLSLSGVVFQHQEAHEKRIDYYAGHYLFAVTYNYIPVSVVRDFDTFLKHQTTIATALKIKTRTLTPKAQYEAVIYPAHVAKAFQVPYGRAGLKITYDYHDDAGALIHTYHGYFTNWMDVQFFHHPSTLESIAPPPKKGSSPS